MYSLLLRKGLYIQNKFNTHIELVGVGHVAIEIGAPNILAVLRDFANSQNI